MSGFAFPEGLYHTSVGFTMAFLSQASPLGSLLLPHNAFQEHAAHVAEWSVTLSSKGSSGTCIPEGLVTFLRCASTAHQGEAIVEPDAMADDLAGKAVMFVACGISGWRHVWLPIGVCTWFVRV